MVSCILRVVVYTNVLFGTGKRCPDYTGVLNKMSHCTQYIENKRQSLTPTSSTSILSRPTGPRELLTMLATDTAAITTHGHVLKEKDGQNTSESLQNVFLYHSGCEYWRQIVSLRQPRAEQQLTSFSLLTPRGFQKSRDRNVIT